MRTHLKECYKEALIIYERENKRRPDHVIVYRDGVGDSQREHVLELELCQLEDAFTALYKQGAKPSITLAIVNKRINQRFFYDENVRKHFSNPVPGSVIDSRIVGNSESEISYDFYMVPQITNQGCALPTHFFVAFNNSGLKKDMF